MATLSSRSSKRYGTSMLVGFLAILIMGGGVAGIVYANQPDDLSSSITVGAQRGQFAPDFALQDINGNNVSLSEYRGQPVLINFWATWCPPCMREMPYLEEAQTYYQNSGLVVLAVNASYSEQSALNVFRYVIDEGLTFPILMDADAAVSDEYYVDSFPITFFIDEAGVIQRIQYGAMEKQDMFSWIDTLLQ